ncbi:hybrid sensor histidine kinase/response regulator [Rhodospirillaceae bacterium SYSU D60014]|uniref:ATP-binding response regulator n=1 Tax=Virgifigura deserti TaxID=2268457 RepID=UPI0013C40147
MITLLFAAAGFLSAWRLVEERDRNLEIFRTGSWIAVQAEIELLQLINAVSAYYYGERPDKEKVFHQFEIFWSRIPLLLEGEEGKILRQLMPTAVIERTADDLFAIERSLKTLVPGDEAAFRALRADLEHMHGTLHDLVLGVMTHETAVQNRERLVRSYAEIFAAFSLVIICGSLLLIMLLRELRQSARLLAQSRRSEQEAAEANFSKSRFLAAASHDLRQPLNALSLLLGLLQSRVTDRSSVELVEKSQESLIHITRQLDSYLDITKLDTGRIAVEPAPVPLGALFERVADTFRDEAARKGLRLRVVESSACVISDAFLLERILANLVSNAIRYTERGAVLIGCRRRDGEIRIDVIDTGPGIAPEHHTAIFEEFHQIANPERAQGDGHGLGLAIVRRLIRLLGHRIELRSVPGRGSCFSITLPVAAATDGAISVSSTEAAAEAAPSTAQDLAQDVARAAPTADPSDSRVLIIENDALIAMSLSMAMEDLGWTSVTAVSAEQALDLVPTMASRPRLIISDYRLPGRNGIEAIDDLRRVLGAEIPAWIVTGDIGQEVRAETHSRNIGHLIKPIGADALRKVVANLDRAKTPADTPPAADD